MINRATLSLKFDKNADIISYEEHQPFGTTSDKIGCSEIDISLNGYKAQLDSKEDQLSITRRIQYAKRKQFRKINLK